MIFVYKIFIIEIQLARRKDLSYMKIEWDYTPLADAYLKRPDYAQDAIDTMASIASLERNSIVCDIGAGAAHLTLMLAKKGYKIHAVEPNEAMRKNGVMRTEHFDNIIWHKGIAEETGMEDNTFNLVSFGSSFNVCNQQLALKESYRILKPQGWFSCMWNHRDLTDPLQENIEDTIKQFIKNYSYDKRREDQTNIIDNSNLYKNITCFEKDVIHIISADDFIEGWRSHGTLHRQANENFNKIIQAIADVVMSHSNDGFVKVPYTTKVWMAQRKT